MADAAEDQIDPQFREAGPPLLALRLAARVFLDWADLLIPATDPSAPAGESIEAPAFAASSHAELALRALPDRGGWLTHQALRLFLPAVLGFEEAFHAVMTRWGMREMPAPDGAGRRLWLVLDGLEQLRRPLGVSPLELARFDRCVRRLEDLTSGPVIHAFGPLERFTLLPSGMVARADVKPKVQVEIHPDVAVVRIGGQEYHVTEEQGAYFKAIADRQGQPITQDEMRAEHPALQLVTNLSRLKGSLPKPLKDLIDPVKGLRLAVERL